MEEENSSLLRSRLPVEPDPACALVLAESGLPALLLHSAVALKDEGRALDSPLSHSSYVEGEMV